MTQQFHALLLSELRMVTYRPGDLAGITDDMLCEAVTVNENLQSLGFVLRPDDMIRLAVSESLLGFYENLAALVPDVKAQPMYPGFPQQVMEMTEAEFRMHQLIHYFSTYGVEELFGEEVSRGWLPEYGGPERTEQDTALLECRVIGLIPEQEAAVRVLKVLLGRRERLTNPELELVRECAPLCGAEQLEGMSVRFKENLKLLFPLLMRLEDRKAALRALRAVCGHTGDVLTLSAEYLREHRYHLSTSDKKILVKLLEAYPARNLSANLMMSLHARERNLLVLQHLDYNRFSRSPEHREAVRALRNSELLSWHGVGEKLLRERSPEALAYLAARPGYMVRMLNRLLSLDYGPEAIREAMEPSAGAISAHLLVKTIRTLLKRAAQTDADTVEKLKAVSDQARDMRGAAAEKWLGRPKREAKEKAFREEKQLESVLQEKEKQLAVRKRILKKLELDPDTYRRPLIRRNANSDFDSGLVYVKLFDRVPEKIAAMAAELETEIESLKEQAARAHEQGERCLAEETARIDAENTPPYLADAEKADLWEKAQIRLYADAAANDIKAAEILKTLLRAHFRQAETPLKGKKVFLSLDQFDLAHSTLETEDRSKDGGYIRSGISYRIPENAKYVRFFVYWNDRDRVDIDLHAGGRDARGQMLHVGWNANYCDCGIVHSGDITHSDAAEYIDIDLAASIREIYANVNLYYGRPCFRDVETCYVGLMAVDQIGQTVKHYDPANCFFTHALTQTTNNLFYGYIDVDNRFVRFVGQPNENGWGDWASRPDIEKQESMFSLKDYLDIVLEGQDVQLADSEEEAEAVLTMGKSMTDTGVSLADSNFFLES